jgi:hypothetical protein
MINSAGISRFMSLSLRFACNAAKANAKAERLKEWLLGGQLQVLSPLLKPLWPRTVCDPHASRILDLIGVLPIGSAADVKDSKHSRRANNAIADSPARGIQWRSGLISLND